MKPLDFTEGKLKTDDFPEIYYWGFILNCWDCFQENQDLRSVRTFLVRDLSKWFIKERKFITDEEIKWCDTIACQDGANAINNKEIIKQWSMAYATVTVVMRKFLVKSWNKKDNFLETLENKRLDYEQWVKNRFNDSVDWHLPSVASGERGSVMEKKLKKLERPQ